MLLKALVYAYICNEYSSRKIEQLLKRDVYFMWLTAMSSPDHNTLNRFRSERLKGEIKEIFTQVVLLLEKEGLVSLQTTFVDGTKIEANANRCIPIQPTPLLYPSIWKILNNSYTI